MGREKLAFGMTGIHRIMIIHGEDHDIAGPNEFVDPVLDIVLDGLGRFAGGQFAIVSYEIIGIIDYDQSLVHKSPPMGVNHRWRLFQPA
jgi:hypothetical protein